MSVVDTIKKSVLENFTGTISVGSMALSLIIAFAIGLFIVYVYRKTYTGVVYSKAYALCIIMLAMVTAMIIRTISSNISLSLGMVGALSIVRFRTAIKEPVDTSFMFWGISAGIMAGAGMTDTGTAGTGAGTTHGTTAAGTGHTIAIGVATDTVIITTGRAFTTPAEAE